MMSQRTLAARVTDQLRTLSEKRGFRRDLAKKMGYKHASAISPYVSGAREVSLDMLEAMAEIGPVPLVELVAPTGSMIKQLDATEAALLRHLRKWPKSVGQHLLQFFSFFADESSLELQTRNVHELWRTLKEPADREALYSYGVMLREGLIQPETIERLAAQLSAGSRAAVGMSKAPEGRR